MTVAALIWIAIGGLLLTTFMATGVRVFHEFSHYELEQYCKRQHEETRFDDIVNWHEKLALAAEGLQSLGTTLLLISGSASVFQLARVEGRVLFSQFSAALLLGTLAVLVANSWIPWAVARLWSSPFLYHTWRIWYVCGRVAWPLTIGFNVVGAFFHRLAGREHVEEEPDEAWEEEVRSIVMTGERGGLVESDLREMIEGVIELDKLAISEIMTPRSKVDAINIDQSLTEILDFVIQAGRTRLPVFEDQLENIIGVLFVKDLLPEINKSQEERAQSIRSLLRTPWFVPKTKPVDSMLKDFLEERNHLAIVLDEYHNVAGVITIEDVLEEIVGEIMDESDSDEEVSIVKTGDRAYEVLASTHIDEINEELGTKLPESEDFSTIAGMILSQHGEIPKPGKIFRFDNMMIEVLDANRRAVHRVRIQFDDDAPLASAVEG